MDFSGRVLPGRSLLGRRWRNGTSRACRSAGGGLRGFGICNRRWLACLDLSGRLRLVTFRCCLRLDILTQAIHNISWNQLGAKSPDPKAVARPQLPSGGRLNDIDGRQYLGN